MQMRLLLNALSYSSQETSLLSFPKKTGLNISRTKGMLKSRKIFTNYSQLRTFKRIRCFCEILCGTNQRSWSYWCTREIYFRPGGQSKWHQYAVSTRGWRVSIIFFTIALSDMACTTNRFHPLILLGVRHVIYFNAHINSYIIVWC